MNDGLRILKGTMMSIFASDAVTDISVANVSKALTIVEKEIYEMDYQDIEFQDLFDVEDFNDPSATSFEYYFVSKAGKAELSNGDGKINWVDSMVQGKNIDLHDGNIGYKFTQKQVERASKIGHGLPAYKAQTAMNAVLELAQQICFYGDDKRGITGFFNNPDVQSITPIGGTDWSAKSAIEIASDINHLFGTAYSITKQKEFKPHKDANRLVLPTVKWTKIATTKMSDNSDKTILQFIVEQCPYLTKAENVISSAEMADDTMRIYQKDKSKVKFVWGHGVRWFAPQIEDLSLKIVGDYSIGGLVVPKPLSMWEMEGI